MNKEGLYLRPKGHAKNHRFLSVYTKLVAATFFFTPFFVKLCL